MTQAQDTGRLTEQMLAALNKVDPAGLLWVVSDWDDHPGPDQEQRIEAEEIVKRIRLLEERSGRLLGAREIAKIGRTVVEEWLEVKVSKRDAKAIAADFCARRLVDLLRETVAEAAAAPIAEGRATLGMVEDNPAGDGIELTPSCPTAAALHVSVEYDALLNCLIAGRYTHEIFSQDPSELLGEVRHLVRSLVEGKYVETERDKGPRATVRAIWPEGRSTTYTFGSGAAKKGWVRRTYDPY